MGGAREGRARAVVRVGGRWNYMYMQRGGKDAKSDVISVHFNDEIHKSYPALGMGIASLVPCSDHPGKKSELQAIQCWVWRLGCSLHKTSLVPRPPRSRSESVQGAGRQR